MTLVHSFTALTTFERCPKQFGHRYILKDLPREEPSPAMAEGNEVHDALEKRIKGSPLPEKRQSLERYARVFDGAPVEAEMKVAVTRAGNATGFFADDAWFRGKIDVVVILPPRAFITDWKTGKKREDPDELEIFAVLLQAARPEVHEITGRYVWLKGGDVGKSHVLTDTATKWQQLKERTAQVERAVETRFFPPREHALCGWCPVKDCQFNPNGGKK